MTDDSGIAYFERAAKTQEETSSDSAFATKEHVPTPGELDGDLTVEKRGKPKE